MSIKNGRLTVRNGIIDALVIERDNTSSKVDTISQLESLKGINFFSLDAINFKTFDAFVAHHKFYEFPKTYFNRLRWLSSNVLI